MNDRAQYFLSVPEQKDIVHRTSRTLEDPAPDLPLSTETCYWLVCFLPLAFHSVCCVWLVLDPPPEPQDPKSRSSWVSLSWTSNRKPRQVARAKPY